MLYSQRCALGWYGARLWRFESAIVSFLTGINFGIRDYELWHKLKIRQRQAFKSYTDAS
jgi:hypothetical protein